MASTPRHMARDGILARSIVAVVSSKRDERLGTVVVDGIGKESTMKHKYEGISKWSKWVGIIGLLAVFLLASAVPVYAWRGGGGWGGGRGWGGGWHGRGGWHGGRGWGGSRVSVGVGVGAFWGAGWGPGWGWGPAWGWGPGWGPGWGWGPAWGGGTVNVTQPSQQLSLQPPAPPTASWYYCDNPQGSYPYVQQCPGGWRAVAPTPQ